MIEARFQQSMPNQEVICKLCPHTCQLAIGEKGKCRVRTNIQGTLSSDTYGRVSAIRLEAVEKKPLYHFHPGKSILSVGTVGCNLRCQFCQNAAISQCNIDEFTSLSPSTPEEIIHLARLQPENIGIAFTYNEPTVWYEYMWDIAKLSQEAGMKNVMITNGYINEEPLAKLLPLIDAFNVDLKAFDNAFYKRLTNASIQPVKRTIQYIAEQKKHLEITNLIIPEENDDPASFEEMVRWIASICGANTPLHLTRYYPGHKLKRPKTPKETLDKLSHIAKQYLSNVYLDK